LNATDYRDNKLPNSSQQCSVRFKKYKLNTKHKAKSQNTKQLYKKEEIKTNKAKNNIKNANRALKEKS
jgi:hypothetical protein